MHANDLAKAAFKLRSHPHAPYSKFSVGAALLTKSGKILTGCNVENVSLGVTICAEQSAVAAAIAEGEKACHVVLASRRWQSFNPEIKIVASAIGADIAKTTLSCLSFPLSMMS